MVIRARAPRRQLSHAARTPVPQTAADSNGDSNNSNLGYRQRPATAHNARTIHGNWGLCPALISGRSVAASGHDPENLRNDPYRLRDQRSSPGRQQAQIR